MTMRLAMIMVMVIMKPMTIATTKIMGAIVIMMMMLVLMEPLTIVTPKRM